MLRMLALVVAGTALAHDALAQSGFHKWIDAEGRVHYSDRPRPESDMLAETAVAASDQALLNQFEHGLRTGDREAVLGLFRYFEELVGPRDAAVDRRIVGYLLRLMEEEFGRPRAFERSLGVSSRYVSAQVESATDAQWNASACLFKTYGLKTHFAIAETTRPAELVVTVCTGPRIERPALRQIEFRFVNPDVTSARKVQAVLERTMVEARRVTGSAH
jgi:hypothetical protein